MYFSPWSITHNVRELSGFFKDLRGTCLTRRLMALSLPGPDTLHAGIISKSCRNIERSSLEGSVLNPNSQLLLQTITADANKNSCYTKGQLLFETKSKHKHNKSQNSPRSIASSFPLISLFIPSVRASNMTWSRWQAARDTVEAPDPITAHSCSIPNSFTIAIVWE